jgi:pyruvate dehydrogenase E2 component (dihydrolipoamide acetyltransferase)
MPMDFVLPELGENIDSADVVNVLVAEGDQIHANQSVVELETDKAVVEIPCPHAGKVTKVHVHKGQKIKVGQPLITVETEQPAGAAPPGPAAPAEASILPAKSSAPPASPPTPAAGPAPAPSVAVASAAGAACELAQATAVASSAGEVDSLIPAGPAARRLARQLGVDLRTVQGTGPRGRIRPEDVQAAAARQAQMAAAGGQPVGAGAVPSALGLSAPAPSGAVPSASAPGPFVPFVPPAASPSVAPAKAPTGPEAVQPWAPVIPPGEPGTDPWGPIRREPMSRIRRTIAAQMVRSASTIPHVTNFDDADITELEALRKSIPPGFLGPDVKLTLMPFLMKAVALALRRHPALNASLDMQPDNEQIIYKEYVNIGVAVDTPRGLVVPVVRNVDRMTIPALARAVAEVAQRARTAQFTIEETRGGTFTISNLGAIGGTYSTPIINFPEVAILLAGRSRWMPVVRGEQIEKRLMLPLSLSYDHRLVDGATAARFLTEVIDWLQNPGKLLLVG